MIWFANFSVIHLYINKLSSIYFVLNVEEIVWYTGVLVTQESARERFGILPQIEINIYNVTGRSHTLKRANKQKSGRIHIIPLMKSFTICKLIPIIIEYTIKSHSCALSLSHTHKKPLLCIWETDWNELWD